MSLGGGRLSRMELLYQVVVVLHFIGLAGVIGGYAAVMRKPAVVPAMLHGAVTQVVTGFLLVGMKEMGLSADDAVNHAKIGVKMIVAVAVLALVIIGKRQGEKGGTLASIAAGLAALNVAVAVFW